MSTDQAFQLLMGAIDRVGEKVDAIDDKIDSKIDNIKAEITRIDIRCESRKVCNADVVEKIKSLESTLKELQESSDKHNIDIRDIRLAEEKNEWKIFLKMTTKLAVFIILLGSTVLFLYQIFEKIRNPAAPLPNMPSLP